MSDDSADLTPIETGHLTTVREFHHQRVALQATLKAQFDAAFAQTDDVDVAAAITMAWSQRDPFVAHAVHTVVAMQEMRKVILESGYIPLDDEGQRWARPDDQADASSRESRSATRSAAAGDQ